MTIFLSITLFSTNPKQHQKEVLREMLKTWSDTLETHTALSRQSDTAHRSTAAPGIHDLHCYGNKTFRYKRCSFGQQLRDKTANFLLLNSLECLLTPRTHVFHTELLRLALYWLSGEVILRWGV